MYHLNILFQHDANDAEGKKDAQRMLVHCDFSYQVIDAAKW